ncbi:MAG: hypothetical protein KIS91_17860, partial [Anaerolineae bacterium]|nr:hypothetical protein [Anaerolineae bacterium]
FHDGNIFLRDGRAVVFDWGDSVLSHPFYSLRTVRVSAEMSLGLDENDPQVDPLDDAYLAPWRGYASHEVLRAALALSRPLASLSSALGWYRVVSTLDAAGREAYAVPVPTLLQEFLSLIIEVVA